MGVGGWEGEASHFLSSKGRDLARNALVSTRNIHDYETDGLHMQLNKFAKENSSNGNCIIES